MRILIATALALAVFVSAGPAAPAEPPASTNSKASVVAATTKRPRKRAPYEFSSWYTEETFSDSAAGDVADGEDLRVRQAAVEALGKFNGSVVVVDTSSGRVLTMVNQKLALSTGFMPCSTIKPMVGLAALNEGIVAPGDKVWFDRTWTMTMVEGLAISNNVYFGHLGEQLGFERVRRYANLFGFGEKAGWNIPGEQLGEFPDTEHEMGIGRMTSFGDGIHMTPLQLAAFTAAIANGGTLHYLQHPLTEAEAETFQPRVKRFLPIAKWIPEVEEGMHQAVKRGTGRNAGVAGQMVWGKTGTCSQFHRPNRQRIRLGWFTSFNEVAGQKLAITVLLRGGGYVVGPRAAEVAGQIYRALGAQEYFTSRETPLTAQSDAFSSAVDPAISEDCCATP
ncbi:MAG: penicillin-binding transpeptidase domain-containing protein [Bryobacterales bacterium]